MAAPPQDKPATAPDPAQCHPARCDAAHAMQDTDPEALQDTIAGLQARRSWLGEASVDAALAPLRHRQAALAAPGTSGAHGPLPVPAPQLRPTATCASCSAVQVLPAQRCRPAAVS